MIGRRKVIKYCQGTGRQIFQLSFCLVMDINIFKIYEIKHDKITNWKKKK